MTIGDRVGRLTVTGLDGKRGNYKFWLCKCDCGASKTVRQDHLREARVRSCGCLARETNAGNQHAVTHGHARIRDGKRKPTYQTWVAMRSRCNDPGAPGYADYGGRGITVCERWESFENFLADMGERPRGTTIDRKDNAGNYEPGNCRWSTAMEQGRNRRSSRLTLDMAQEALGRLEYGEGCLSIAHRLGVSRGAIRGIQKGENWRDLPRGTLPRQRRRSQSVGSTS